MNVYNCYTFIMKNSKVKYLRCRDKNKERLKTHKLSLPHLNWERLTIQLLEEAKWILLHTKNAQILHYSQALKNKPLFPFRPNQGIFKAKGWPLSKQRLISKMKIWQLKKMTRWWILWTIKICKCTRTIRNSLI